VFVLNVDTVAVPPAALRPTWAYSTDSPPLLALFG
jgi:hypothetical protein